VDEHELLTLSRSEALRPLDALAGLGTEVMDSSGLLTSAMKSGVRETR
jgi:hypothetical protein